MNSTEAAKLITGVIPNICSILHQDTQQSADQWGDHGYYDAEKRGNNSGERANDAEAGGNEDAENDEDQKNLYPWAEIF